MLHQANTRLAKRGAGTMAITPRHYLDFINHYDVESYDPILNPVLNHEVPRTGGRVLITLGDQDVDLSPAFTIFLSTRDPSLGAAEERPPGPAVAGATGEEAPLPHPSFHFQALPHSGDQPQGASGPAEGFPCVHLRASPRGQGQPHQDLQHRPCRQSVQGTPRASLALLPAVLVSRHHPGASPLCPPRQGEEVRVQRMSCDMLDTWLESVVQGRTNLPPDKVPWSAFRTLLSQCLYGGRIDNDFHQRLLNSFRQPALHGEELRVGFPLMSSIDGTEGKSINMPNGIRREQFLQWVEHLPDNQTPWLPNNVEKVLLTNKEAAMIAKLLKMQSLGDDDEFISTVSTTIMT